MKWDVSLPSLNLILFISTWSRRTLVIWNASDSMINSEWDERMNSTLCSLESDTTSYVFVIIWWTRVLWIEQKEEDLIYVSVINWSSFEELRCLFVREGWSEYSLWLWRHSCSRMHLEDTHRWDWACLVITHSGWESLSRVMWRGFWSDPLPPVVISVVS